MIVNAHLAYLVVAATWEAIVNFFKVFMGLIPLASGQWLPKEGGIREEHTAFHVSKCCGVFFVFCFFTKKEME